MSVFRTSSIASLPRALPGLLAGMLLGGSLTMAREPVPMASDDDRLILESFLKHTVDNVGRFTPEAVAAITQPEDICWNGSVDAPVFRTTGGQEPKEAGMSTFVAPALAAFAPAIVEYCYGPRATRERLDKREHGWQGGVSAMGYLAGKYLERRSLEPSRLSLRDRFAAKPDNAAFLREMEYQVPTPAAP